MRKALLIVSALLTSTALSNAADMATKAPPFSAYPTARCGLYYGINAEGGAGVVPNAPAGTTMIAGDIGVLIGYACPTGVSPWFVENIVDFQNLNAGTNGFSMSGPVHVEQRAGVQTPLIPFFASLTGGTVNTGTPPNLPLLPPSWSVQGTPTNYVYVAVNEDDISGQFGLATARKWLVSPEVGTGLLYKLVNTSNLVVVADTFAGVEMQSDSFCLGAGMCPKLGVRFKVGQSFKY